MFGRWQRLLAMLVFAAAGVLVWSWMQPKGSAPEEGELALYSVRESRETTLGAALPDLARSGLVFVGEAHSELADHQAQLAVIQALHNERRPMAVGLEMIAHRHQNELDAWVAGEISEAHIRDVFRLDWGFDWELYRPIFMFCRKEGIPMLGINVPRDITRKVSRQGFASLSDSELRQLPPLSCEVHPDYEQFLRIILGAHGPHGGGEDDNPHGGQGMDEATFQKFCEAQVVWDVSMAYYSLEHLKTYPNSCVVVLCGTVHAWKKAAPSQVARLQPDVRQRVLLPEEAGRLEPGLIDASDADYLIMR